MLKQITLVTLVAFALQVNCVLSWDYRLGNSVVPDFYDISIKPFFAETASAKRFTFEGEVQIELHAVVSGIMNITLHKKDLNISEAQLYSSSNVLIENIPLTSLYYEEETNKLTVALSRPLTEWTNYTLYFTYTGLIRNGSQEGLYAAHYPSAGNKTTWIVLTQLQRLHARTVFPCFDEPSFKATFQVQISRPKDYASFSNTKKISTTTDGLTRETDDFAVTPLMSTYMVAFIVAPYAQRGGNDSFIITRPEFIDKTEFAYNVTMKTLDAYNNYTKLPYSSLGNSLFQQSTSPSFPYSGMENWGLILYKDGVLVQFPDYSDGWADKQRTLSTIVHEIAHMWFGNSVTFAWWSYFWLNEGFARYYQYFMANELYPEYRLDQQFVVDQLQMILASDSVNSTQPMTSPEESVRTPLQIGNKFSSIAYAKGASIIHMFRNAMGPSNFDNAIRDYLQMNHLRNTIPKDLFYHLKRHWPKQQNVDLDTFFSDWTEQVGFPMLTVELSTSAKSVLIKQKRFLFNPKDGSDSKLRYTIPITVATNLENNFQNLTPKLYLSKSVQTFKLDLKGPVSWVILNLQQANYYRVFYHEKLLKNIEKALKEKDHSGIHVINRAQLISDLFSFARIGQIEYQRVFQFIEYLKENENEYLPWHAAFIGLGEVAARLKEDKQTYFSYYVGNLTSNLYERLGFISHNDSSILDIYNRNHVIKWMCKYDLDNCGAIAVSLYRRWKLEDIQVSPDFRETFYCAAVRKKPQISQDLLTFYRQTSIVSEQEKLLRAMGCTKHSSYAQAFYDFLLDEVPEDQIATGLKALYTSNQENVEETFAMIRQTDKVLAQKLGGWSELANIISDLAHYFTTEEEKEDFDEYIEKRGSHYGPSEVILDKALKTVEYNLEWADDRLDDLVHFLKKRNGAVGLQLSFVLAALAFFVNFYFI